MRLKVAVAVYHIGVIQWQYSITRKIKDSENLMDIQLLDHLINLPEGHYYNVGDYGII